MLLLTFNPSVCKFFFYLYLSPLCQLKLSFSLFSILVINQPLIYLSYSIEQFKKWSLLGSIIKTIVSKILTLSLYSHSLSLYFPTFFLCLFSSVFPLTLSFSLSLSLSLTADKTLPHQTVPSIEVSPEVLAKLGVLYWNLEWTQNPTERSYVNACQQYFSYQKAKEAASTSGSTDPIEAVENPDASDKFNDSKLSQIRKDR
jgi:hypothetical protein